MAESSTTSEVQTLIQAGNAALVAGDTYEARQRFRRATELEPENVEAWMGLAGSVRPYSEKREHLQRALTLDPGNGEVRASLEYVEGKIAAGEVLAPRGVTEPKPERVPDDLIEEGDLPLAAHETETQYCYLHPDRETGLRCTHCDRPICSQCLVRAPVGQLCPECARARRPRNYQVSANTLLIAVPIALISSALVSVLVALFLRGFFAFIIAFIIAPFVAEFIVRVLDRLTHAKRGRTMQIAVGVSIGLGAAPMLMLTLSLPLLLFIIITISTAVTRLR